MAISDFMFSAPSADRREWELEAKGQRQHIVDEDVLQSGGIKILRSEGRF